MDDDIKPTINTTPPPTTTSTTSTTSNSATAPNAPSDPNGGSSTAATGKRYRAAPAKTFACRGYGECRMVFSRSEHLARHVRKHTGERPFQCHCGKQFSRLDNLRQHAQTVHADKQDQNERMMRELTSLHTSMSASAKRDGRRKAAESRAIGAVNPGLPPHPSLQHPSLMQGHSMVQSPIGMAPGYPSPTGQGMPTHMSGHMHAQSMSAAIGHTPGYHDAVPSARYGRGRPGTSAGYEGGFDPHNAYDPRRWPHAGPPPGSGAQHPSLGGWHGDASAAVAGFGTSSPTTAHHPSNTTPSHPYPTPDESNAGFREGGFHRPPVPVAAPAQAPSQTTTSSSSTSQPHPQAPQASQAAQAAQAQAHPGQSTRDPQAQALGFRDGSGLGFRQQQHHPNTPNSSSSSNGQAAGFGLNSNSNNNNHNNSGMGNSTSSADMTGLPTEQGFRDTGGTSSSFRDGSFRGDAGAGGSYGRDAPRYDDDDDDEREDDEARGDRGGDDRMDTDVPPSAPDEPLHRRHGDEYDDESRPGAYGGSFRRAADARFYARPPPADGRYPRSPTPDSPAPRDAPQPRPFAESQPGRYEQPRARAEYERPPGAYYAGEREYGPAPTARDRDGYGYGYGYDRYRDAYGYADRPSSSYARGAESPPSSTSSAGTATYYAREREHERSPPASRRTGTASGVLLPDAFAFAGRPGTAPAAYASGYGGGGGGGGSLGRRLGAEPSSPTGYNDSPFSFHPPGLGGPPPIGAYASPTPATSSQSTASAASLHAHALAGPGVAPASSSRKRAAPDSDFDAVERTRPGTGYQQQRPTTGSASRPQSRRLSVMELCHDEDARPPTSGGGGERAGFARTQRLLPVSSSRPGTSGGSDGHLVSFFRRPDTASGRGDYGYGHGHGHGGGGGRPDTAGGGGRPGSSGSPFAFAHPGDVAAVRLSPDAPAAAAAARSGGDATGNSSGSSTPGRRLLPSPSGGSGGKKSTSITPRASASVSPVLSAGAGASPPLSAARAEGIVGVAKGSPGVRV